MSFQDDRLETAQKQPFLDTKSAVKQLDGSKQHKTLVRHAPLLPCRFELVGCRFGATVYPLLDKQRIVVSFQDNRLKTAQKRPFLDTKWAVNRAKRLESTQNSFPVMRVCFLVVLSHLDAGFEPQCSGYRTNQRSS